MDNPLLSYIDVRHANFLPLQLTVGEARDLGPRYTTADSIDRQRTLWQILYLKAIESTYSSKSKEHQPAVAESVNSSGVGTDQDEEMVTKRTMTIDRFLLGTRPVIQP